jgi:hypothetical protein
MSSVAWLTNAYPCIKTNERVVAYREGCVTRTELSDDK